MKSTYDKVRFSDLPKKKKKRIMSKIRLMQDRYRHMNTEARELIVALAFRDRNLNEGFIVHHSPEVEVTIRYE